MKTLQRPSLGFLLCLALLIGGIAFYRYGRNVWSPIVRKVRGQKTVADVLRRLGPEMRRNFADLDRVTDGKPLALLAFKEERRLEVWKRMDADWRFRKSYPFTAFSGRLGPKLREGDLQIPEGIYGVEYLNPNSRYHLSIKVDYPNAFDREKARQDRRVQLGGDIFIHGMDATIGCIPIGNANIEELFYLVAQNGFQNTQVIIAPYDMRTGSKRIDVEGIAWEDELYEALTQALRAFPFSNLPKM